MGLIESTSPATGYRLIDPCARCGHAEGVWSVPWPDVPADRFYLLCERCLWRKFNELPKSKSRRALAHKVFAPRVSGYHSH